MAISIDTTQYDPAGSFDSVAAGKCHVQMIEFREFGAKPSGDHIAKFEVLNHEDPEMIGHVHTEYFNQKPKAAWLLQALAVGLGMNTKDEFIAASQSGKPIDLDFPAATGRQCLAEIRNEVYDNKDRFKISGRFYLLTDPTKTTYPVNYGSVSVGKCGVDPATIPARTQSTAKPATASKPATTPPATLADAPW